jgi:hypothetical protein
MAGQRLGYVTVDPMITDGSERNVGKDHTEPDNFTEETQLQEPKEVNINTRTICLSTSSLLELLDTDKFCSFKANSTVLHHMPEKVKKMIDTVLPLMLKHQKHDWDMGVTTVNDIVRNRNVEFSAQWVINRVDQYLQLPEKQLKQWNIWLANLWPSIEALGSDGKAKLFSHYGQKVLEVTYDVDEARYEAKTLLRNMNTLLTKGYGHVLAHLSKKTNYYFRKTSLHNLEQALEVIDDTLKLLDKTRLAMLGGGNVEMKLKTIWKVAHMRVRSELDFSAWRRFGVKWTEAGNYLKRNPAAGPHMVRDRHDITLLQSGYAIDYMRYLRPMRLETTVGHQSPGEKGPVVLICVKPIPKGHILGIVPGTLRPSHALTEADREIAITAFSGLRLIPTANPFSPTTGPAMKDLQPNVAVTLNWVAPEYTPFEFGLKEARFLVVSIQKIAPFTPLVALNTE